MSYSDCCDWSQCILCGQCLIKCPVMQMNKDEAKLEMERLIKGNPSPRVFKECTLCFNCNNYCPEGLRPHELILQRILENRKTIPEYIKYFIAGMPAPTLWDDVGKKLSDEEKDILKHWAETPPPSREVLFIGCVGRASSVYDIEHSNVLKSLPKYGPADLCCGELAYRMGAWDTYTQMIEKTMDRFKSLSIERLVTYCSSCYNFFTNILPRVYGKKLPFEVISLYQWLWEKVEKGELKVKYPVKFKAAVCESCYISELGSEFPDTLRKLYKHIGVQILELEHHGNDNLSCGIIAMARNKNFPMSFLSMLKAQHVKYKEVSKTGTNKMALNCPGCFLTFGFTNLLYGKKLIYMPDELLSAFGDNITSPIQKRFPRFFISMTKRIPSWLIMKDYDQLPRIK